MWEFSAIQLTGRDLAACKRHVGRLSRGKNDQSVCFPVLNPIPYASRSRGRKGRDCWLPGEKPGSRQSRAIRKEPELGSRRWLKGIEAAAFGPLGSGTTRELCPADASGCLHVSWCVATVVPVPAVGWESLSRDVPKLTRAAFAASVHFHKAANFQGASGHPRGATLGASAFPSRAALQESSGHFRVLPWLRFKVRASGVREPMVRISTGIRLS
jgi:hypothetical protein